MNIFRYLLFFTWLNRLFAFVFFSRSVIRQIPVHSFKCTMVSPLSYRLREEPRNPVT